ncbi:hypothetical protein [Dyella sp. C11]|uniref:hypothetical protein n=1 Tax=Dyella sp. C11 TaxID=2126991 RepID=UPI000D6504B1|nr:hypothetical protein [Dyella sp. C11]
MIYVEIACFVIGVVALVIGYRRNQRNLLLVAAIVLFLAGSVGDFAGGFKQGLQQGAKVASQNR